MYDSYVSYTYLISTPRSNWIELLICTHIIIIIYNIYTDIGAACDIYVCNTVDRVLGHFGKDHALSVVPHRWHKYCVRVVARTRHGQSFCIVYIYIYKYFQSKYDIQCVYMPLVAFGLLKKKIIFCFAFLKNTPYCIVIVNL